MSQIDVIVKHMSEYGSITPLEAMKEYGIMRLASRISDMRRVGIPVYSEMETAKNRNGEPVRYARYYLKRGDLNANGIEVVSRETQNVTD